MFRTKNVTPLPPDKLRDADPGVVVIPGVADLNPAAVNRVSGSVKRRGRKTMSQWESSSYQTVIIVSLIFVWYVAAATAVPLPPTLRDDYPLILSVPSRKSSSSSSSSAVNVQNSTLSPRGSSDYNISVESSCQFFASVVHCEYHVSPVSAINVSSMVHVHPDVDVISRPPRRFEVCGSHRVVIGGITGRCSGCLLHSVQCMSPTVVELAVPEGSNPVPLFQLGPTRIPRDFGVAPGGDWPCFYDNGLIRYCRPLYVHNFELYRAFDLPVTAVLANTSVVTVECERDRCYQIPSARAYSLGSYILPARNVSASNYLYENWQKALIVFSLAVYANLMVALVVRQLCIWAVRAGVRYRYSALPTAKISKRGVLRVAAIAAMLGSRRVHGATYICRGLTTIIDQYGGILTLRQFGEFTGYCGDFATTPAMVVPRYLGGLPGGLNSVPPRRCAPYLAGRLYEAAIVSRYVIDNITWTVDPSYVYFKTGSVELQFGTDCVLVIPGVTPPATNSIASYLGAESLTSVRDRVTHVEAIIRPIVPSLIFLLAVCRQQYLIAVLSLMLSGTDLMSKLSQVMAADEVLVDYSLPLSVGATRIMKAKDVSFSLSTTKFVEYYSVSLIRNYTQCSFRYRETIHCYASSDLRAKSRDDPVALPGSIQWVRCGQDCPRCLMYQHFTVQWHEKRAYCDAATQYNCLLFQVEYTGGPQFFQQYAVSYLETAFAIAINGTDYSAAELRRGVRCGGYFIRLVDDAVRPSYSQTQVYAFRNRLYTEQVISVETSMDSPKFCRVDKSGGIQVDTNAVYRAAMQGVLSVPQSPSEFFDIRRGYFTALDVLLPAPAKATLNSTAMNMEIHNALVGKVTFAVTGKAISSDTQPDARLSSASFYQSECSTADPSAIIKLAVVAENAGRVHIGTEGIIVTPTTVSVLKGPSTLILMTPARQSIRGTVTLNNVSVVVNEDCLEWAGALLSASSTVDIISRAVAAVPLDFRGFLVSLTSWQQKIVTAVTIVMVVIAVILLIFALFKLTLFIIRCRSFKI